MALRNQARLLQCFLLLMVVLATGMFAKGDMDHHDDDDDKNHQVHDDYDSSSTVHNDDDLSSDMTSFDLDNNLLLTLTSRHIDVTVLESHLGQNFLLLVLVHDESCPSCPDMVQRVRDASTLFQTIAMDELHQHDDNDVDKPAARFATILVRELTDDWLAAIDAVPTLLFWTVTTTTTSHDNHSSDHQDLSHENNSSTLVWLEYNGLASCARDIADTMLHYSWRLQTLSRHIGLGRGDMVLPNVPTLQHVDDVYDFVALQRPIWLRLLHNDGDSNYQSALVRTGMTATGEWTTAERQYLEWMFYSAKVLAADDLRIFVHCRQHGRNNEELVAAAFEQFAQVVSNRRDCLFLSVSECDSVSDSADLLIYSISLQQFSKEDWTLPLPARIFTESPQRLTQLLLQMSTPSVLGFDRQLTAPIAFPLFRKVHAVLFIDIYHIPENINEWGHGFHATQRQAIGSFQRVCQNQRRRMLDNVEQDLVCLVVPSSETRVLASFGIDIWGPLDRQLFESLDSDKPLVPTSVLPSLVVTDQRYGGTRRYYLDGDLTEESMAMHLDEFWAGNLQPERHSDHRGPRTNKAGVRIVTADSVRDEVIGQRATDQHAMILFTAPTCGHCKRFKTLFNQLSDILFHVGWNDMLALYELDVTKNDLLDLNVTVRWVPDLYYIAPADARLVPYTDANVMDDGVGSVNSPLEILEWFLDVSSLPDSDIQSLFAKLQSLQ